ncbi:MAG: CoA transferase [Halioglobus sp.]|nr:CoA transferase [Halioglobus sp.]
MTPDQYAHDLLTELQGDTSALKLIDSRCESDLWAESGAQYLTGETFGPTLPSPALLATAARGTWLALSTLGDRTLDPSFPAHQLLGERAAILGLQRQGAVSPGGACHLLHCADGQIALNLPREEDWRLLPAWLECEVPNLEAATHAVRHRPSAELVARARWLGLAAARHQSLPHTDGWHQSTRLSVPRPSPRRPPLVVDLSTIWAGPLCAAVLGELGARVIKVESTSRPDGARGGPPAFFDLLNGSKSSVALDLDTPRGRNQLRQLCQRADIVVESARPRGLEQMGIQAANIVRGGSGITWLSITGYGRAQPMGHWIAYGDDAGVAAGLTTLLQHTSGQAVFCGDAVADPLTGLHGALLGWLAWHRGGGLLLDITLVGVVRRCISVGHSLPRGNTTPVAQAPVSRRPSRPAAALGDHTAEVLSELAIPL